MAMGRLAVRHFVTGPDRIRRLWTLRVLCPTAMAAALFLAAEAYKLGDSIWFAIAGTLFCINAGTSLVNWLLIAPAPRK